MFGWHHRQRNKLWVNRVQKDGKESVQYEKLNFSHREYINILGRCANDLGVCSKSHYFYITLEKKNLHTPVKQFQCLCVSWESYLLSACPHIVILIYELPVREWGHRLSSCQSNSLRWTYIFHIDIGAWWFCFPA